VLRKVALGCGMALWMGSALADPGYYLLTPYDNEGQTLLELRYWTVKPSSGRPATLWPELGLAHGFGPRWTTRLLASYIGTEASSFKLSSVSWQNQFMLTQGQYPFDLALHAQLSQLHGYESGPTLEWGPVWQSEWGLWQINLNALFEHGYGEAADGGTQLKLQWQLQRRLAPGLRLGVQGFSELGNWRAWDARAKQSHRVGPVLHWALPVGERQAVNWQFAYLWGSTYGRRGDMFSAQLQFAF